VFNIPESVFNIPGIGVHVPGIRVHVRLESVFKIVRNTHPRRAPELCPALPVSWHPETSPGDPSPVAGGPPLPARLRCVGRGPRHGLARPAAHRTPGAEVLAL